MTKPAQHDKLMPDVERLQILVEAHVALEFLIAVSDDHQVGDVVAQFLDVPPGHLPDRVGEEVRFPIVVHFPPGCGMKGLPFRKRTGVLDDRAEEFRMLRSEHGGAVPAHAEALDRAKCSVVSGAEVSVYVRNDLVDDVGVHHFVPVEGIPIERVGLAVREDVDRRQNLARDHRGVERGHHLPCFCRNILKRPPQGDEELYPARDELDSRPACQ